MGDGDPKQIRLVRNYWYFVVLHLTVSLYSKNCKWRLSVSLYNVLYGTPLVTFPKNGQNWTFCPRSIVLNHFSVYFEQYYFVHIPITITFRRMQIFKNRVILLLLTAGHVVTIFGLPRRFAITRVSFGRVSLGVQIPTNSHSVACSTTTTCRAALP